VDCLWVGHFDLSVSLGIPGQFDHKDFLKAIDKVIAATTKRRKSLGRLVPTVDQGTDFFAQGFDFICYSGDVWVLHNALAEALSALRAKCKPKARARKA
jgi:2-dehydro-3-deoxyglucarate aldolase/4-hydroxy-2-oxoheptanedioate aldolase